MSGPTDVEWAADRFPSGGRQPPECGLPAHSDRIQGTHVPRSDDANGRRELEETASDAGPNYVRLLNLLAASQIALYLTTSIWVGPFEFPQVPLWSMCRNWPAAVDTLAFVGSLAGTWFARTAADKVTRRVRHAVCALSLAVLFSFNQHRLQPWAYQFFILHAWLALARPRDMLTGWRWLTISIYFYSALSKVDYGFCTNHGPFLWDGFLQACGSETGTARWPAQVRFLTSAAMPLTELLAAGCLCFRRTQRAGLVLSILMHLFLIVALGPWGHDHSTGVLLWNGVFIVQNWLLFPSQVPLDEPIRAGWRILRHGDGRRSLFSSPLAPGERVRERGGALRVARHFIAFFDSDRCSDSRPVIHRPPLPGPLPRGGGEGTKPVAWMVLAIALIAPLGEPFGWWDHWPSWAVYAARPERTRVFIHEDDLDRIPVALRRYLQPPPPLEPWHPFRLDRWSLDAGRVPIYPQSRFHVGVALALAERHELSTLRLTLDSPPDRRTGKRDRTEFIGVSALQELAARYRLNANPRQVGRDATLRSGRVFDHNKTLRSPERSRRG